VKRIFARKRVLMFEKNQLFSCWILNQGIQPPCQAGFGMEMEDYFYKNFVNIFFFVILAS
jgi:hypothetical protein